MTLTEFLDQHDAFPSTRMRAKSFTSLEDAWQNCTPDDLVWVATRPAVLTEKELRMFAVFCARSVQHLLRDPRSHTAIEVGERYAQGKATVEELKNARADALVVARAEAYTTAAETYGYAASAACSACARARSVRSAARSASDTAAIATASFADLASASTARKQQAEWLRQNTQPNFN